ncbi:hypothetical protein PRZ48_013965 [Zasmidium cellare]|uniref:Major facilitator superfamily (MFS) profile domain-containing protein n=1 Tax=Zasmidium cellare TaxID=395010 RepID=A0ABR0DZU1_ZASCE|nr:hypothetical protein PRZ48_013965 [Zasmidium cellare]
MSASRYESVAAEDKAADESSTSARLTPDSDSDDDELGGLDQVEAEEGYELRPVGKHSPRLEEHATAGAEEDDEDDHAPLAGGRHRRQSSIQSFELYTPDEERRVKRKLDTRLVLFVALLYFLSFVDRSNIGEAKVAGLTRDLKLSDDQFEWLLTAFYIAYVLFEWMTLCYKIFPPHIYISCCVCAWGILASLQSLSTGFAFMIILRGLLGIGEAAFVGMPFYLSFFFRRDELAFRTGIFIAAAPFATSFASFLAYAIVLFGKSTGIASWRLLFLLEGFPACLVAVWAWYWIPDSPGTARWLTSRERKVATMRMRNESAVDMKSEKSNALHTNVPRHKRKFKWDEVQRTLIDPKSYLTAGMFFCCNVAFSSMPVFLPTILNSMGYTRLAAQGLSAPPFLFAFFVVLITTLVSDRVKSRSIPMIVHALLAMSGYIFLAIAGVWQIGHTLRYLAVFPICSGFFSAVAIVITWTINNQASDEGKGTGMAVLNVIGQMGPLLGTRLYPDSDAPYFVTGMSVCAVAMALVAVLAFVLRLVLQRENAGRRDRWRGGVGDAGKEFEYII